MFIQVEPSSSFKLSLNQNELNARNDVILPYIKQQDEKENRIIIDQEDLNELYEEDPDGDLDFQKLIQNELNDYFYIWNNIILINYYLCIIYIALKKPFLILYNKYILI